MPENTFDILSNDADIVSAYAWRTSFLTFEALKQREEQKMGWNDLLVDFYRLSKAHSQYLVVKSFLSTLEDPETHAALDKPTLDIFRNLFRPKELPIVPAVAVILILLSIIPVYLAHRLSTDDTGLTPGRGGGAATAPVAVAEAEATAAH